MDRYEDIVKDVCLTSWSKLMSEKKKYEESSKPIPQDLRAEIDGWIGVSCIFAYMKKGVKPTNIDMAQHFSTTPESIEMPLKRLIVNGVLNPKRDIRNDNVLLGRNCSADSSKTAWGYIAGISAGLTGLR